MSDKESDLLKKEFSSELFKLSKEMDITAPYTNLGFGDCLIQRKMRKILYKDEPIIFTFSGERVCRYGISPNNFFSVSFDPKLDSSFFIFLEKILTEIRKIYPNILTNFLQVKTIKVNIVEFTNFYLTKPPIKTKFKINSMKVGFFKIENLYKNGILDKSTLDLIDYEIYL